MSRPHRYILDAGQAKRVRRIVSEKGWAAAARALGWPVANARQNVLNALRFASLPPTSPKEAAPEEAALAAAREAEADPVLSRRCAKCGRPNHRIVRGHGAAGPFAAAVGFVRRGGRWLCPDCAPRRPRPTEWQRRWGDPPEAYGPAK